MGRSTDGLHKALDEAASDPYADPAELMAAVIQAGCEMAFGIPPMAWSQTPDTTKEGYRLIAGMVRDECGAPIAPELRAAIGRAHAFLAAWKAMDTALDDNEVEAGREFAEIVERYGETRDAITDADLALLAAVAEGGAA